MTDRITPAPEEFNTSGPFTEAETELIHQLRRLQLKRAQHIQQPGQGGPLGLIKYEGRSYLEVRQGYVPILVPEHLQSAARICLSENFRRYNPNRARLQQQVQASLVTPPNSSPILGPAMMGAPIIPQLEQQMLYLQNNGINSPPMDPQPYVPSSGPSSPNMIQSLPNNNTMPANYSHNFTQMDQSTTTQYGLNSPPNTLGVLEDEPEPTPTPSSSAEAEAEEKPAKTVKASRHRRSVSDNSTSLSGWRKPSPQPSSTQPLDDIDEQPNHNDNDDDIDDTATVKSEEPEDTRDQLRKPPNAFILYRKDKNKGLRKDKPTMSVELASAIIGKLWREESDDVKAKYKQLAQEERDKYFALKKKLQARLKRKKSGPGSPPPRSSAKDTDSASTTSAREIIFPSSHSLSSLSPEAHSHFHLDRSGSGHIGINISQSPRYARSLTLGATPHNFTSLGFDAQGLVANDAANFAPTPTFGQFNTDLGMDMSFGMSRSEPFLGLSSSVPANSLSQLGMQFSQPMSPPAMELDIMVTTAAALQSLTAMSNVDVNMAGWPASPPAGQGEFDGMLSSLFRGEN
ncbi:slightly ste11-like protein [Coemansia sp. RSA 1199]|nr:slightly ste11-like protein [Coemansia sp. RSA 1199]